MKYETIPNLKMGMGTTSTALEKATVALEKATVALEKVIMWASNACAWSGTQFNERLQ